MFDMLSLRVISLLFFFFIFVADKISVRSACVPLFTGQSHVYTCVFWMADEFIFDLSSIFLLK